MMSAAGRGKVPRYARDDSESDGARRPFRHNCHPERSEGPLRLWSLCLMILMLLAFPSLAVEPSETLKDPALEARARSIGQALRCVVCQNQSIDDSSAEVAHDMRVAVRERLVAGDSDAQVFDYMVARYGDYVLLKPPFKTGTWLLWLGAPLLLLVASAAILLTALRRRATAPLPPLSDEERERLKSLLGR